MSADIPTVEPAELVAGDTWKWKRSLADYSAADGWSLRYVFTGAAVEQRFTFDSAADGADHLVSRATTDTDDIVPGVYQWAAFVRNGSERYQVATGTVTVKPNLEGTRPFDVRTHAQKMVEAIEAALEAFKLGRKRYTIGDRSYEASDVDELRAMRAHYRREVADAASIANGGTSGPLGRIRFGVPQ